ncbi:MAG: CDP-alcohol phosphatidyltransferase family protein [Promethearchaeota archaeon]
MPSKFRLRIIFKPLITGLARLLSLIGVTPNMVTFIMLIFSILSYIFLVFFRNLLFSAIFIFLAGISDGVDGALARISNKSSKFGSFLDSTLDRFSEFFIFLGLLLYCWDFMLWNVIDMKIIIFFSLFASLMISYSRARAETIFKGDFDFGLMARSERLFYLVVSQILGYFIGYLLELLFFFMFLVIGTAIFRFFKINTLIKKNDSQAKESQKKEENSEK